jgi:hypothetical protein
MPIFTRPSFFSRGVKITAFAALFAATDRVVYSQGFTDPGFENYAVSAGGFLKPESGPWLFGKNTDAGVVEPYAPNSSNGPLDTWSSTFSAYEGQQYASTYAGSDTIRQEIVFDAAGNYTVFVHAAAPDGSVTIPSVGTLPLEDGEFTFTLDNVWIGNLQTVPKGSSWNSYNTMFTIPNPGNYILGIRTTKSAPYFINYDAFAVQPVPEPTAFILMISLGAVIAGVKVWRRRRH